MLTDPIGDMLARIRNAQMARHKQVRVPYSKLKFRIAEILKDQGFVKDVWVEGEKPSEKAIVIELKYTPDGEPVIRELRRVSKPGRRVYAGVDKLPRVRKGLGIAIISTPKGIMTDKQARKERVGGEIICTVF